MTYALDMLCVSGDQVQVTILQKSDVKAWLGKLDHEGSVWNLFRETPEESENITEEFLRELEQGG